MTVILDMLIWLFERAYLVAYKGDMADIEHRRRNTSWDDCMREWCRRDDFLNALPPRLLRGKDPEFQRCILRVAPQERANALVSVY